MPLRPRGSRPERKQAQVYFKGLMHTSESFRGVDNLCGAPGIVISSGGEKGTRIRFGKFSSSPLSLRNPSEGISNAWDSQETPDCPSQALRLLSGLRDIFLVKVIIDCLDPWRAKPNHEAHLGGTRR